jgi:Ca-activated chloride channel family protein
MRDGDRVTVVAFDTTATVVVPPTTVDAASRPDVEAAIRTMRAGGDTCLSCALERASDTLEASPGPRDEARRILLISDGEATTGIRDSAGLRRLASRTRDRGQGISTIGVDLTFDEKVMAAIAQEGNGRHWFVQDPSALAEVFEQELGSLESAVATEAELVIEPSPGVVLEDVLDRSFTRDGARVRVPLGAFDARQEKTVLVRARVPSGSVGLAQVARLSLAYRDVLARKDAECAGELAIDVRDDGTAQRELDPFVATRLERGRTTHALLDANKLFEKGRADEARAELLRRQNEIALAAPTAVARATAGGSFAGGVDKDFGAQQSALSRAEEGFGAAASAAPRAAAPAPPAANPVGKAALKTNQASASDLTF